MSDRRVGKTESKGAPCGSAGHDFLVRSPSGGSSWSPRASMRVFGMLLALGAAFSSVHDSVHAQARIDGPAPNAAPESRPDFARRPPPPARYYTPPVYEASSVTAEAPVSGPAAVYYVYVDGRPSLVPYPRVRYYRNQPILRPYGGWYSGYGNYLTDEEASRWIGFSSITLPILSKLDDTQQRALEDAQIKASEAPVGERVDWRERDAIGTAQTVREFKDGEGNYCREFEQTVTVDSRTERAQGAACQDKEGVWQVLTPKQ